VKIVLQAGERDDLGQKRAETLAVDPNSAAQTERLSSTVSWG